MTSEPRLSKNAEETLADLNNLRQRDKSKPHFLEELRKGKKEMALVLIRLLTLESLGFQIPVHKLVEFFLYDTQYPQRNVNQKLNTHGTSWDVEVVSVVLRRLGL